MILVRGRPGVGKTAISNRLSKHLHLPILRKDDFYDAAALYVKEHEHRNKISYGILFQFLETNSKADGSWILDFPFNRQDEILRFRAWLEERGYLLFSVLCVCRDETVWADRLNQRKRSPLPNQLITDFAELKAYYGDLSILPLPEELVVDTTEPLDLIMEKILTFLNRGQ
ncbi:AAA family ATPase [Paenibacillus sp. 32352]|uniref:AAA family ATPase n=1 Tax=Paenibacillus sp. 32352 TaxID=1969111 RepID=UPI00211962EF|nr:AAA family ATPase [Paenibacillus sp. 32352]